MNFAVVTPNFPTKKSISFMFLEQLCREFADQGQKVIVVAPQSVTKLIKKKTLPEKVKNTIYTSKGNEIVVYRPYYFSWSDSRFTTQQFCKVVYKTLEKYAKGCDVVYGHFWESAYAGLRFASQYGKPLYAVAGEDYIVFDQFLRETEKEELREKTNGVICVSTKSKDETLKHKLSYENRCEVIPNAINPKLFYVKDKMKLRNRFMIQEDDFVVAFVGQFSERKGPLRLCEALNRIGNPKIKTFFLGSGPQDPVYSNTLVKGTINHDELPDYLNASDVFVLPTLSEGCCNAMIEAMACGLPIISSDASFNWDVLNGTNSILIDPNSVSQIQDSIMKLYNDKQLRNKLAEGAKVTASGLTLKKRAERIVSFISKSIRV